MRKLGLWLVWLMIVLGPNGVVAASEVRWSVPAGCPDAAALEREVDALLGRPLRTVDTLDVDAAIHEQGPNQFALTLRTTPRVPGVAASTRELSAADCQELLEAAAVAITLAVTNSVAATEHARVAPSPSAAKTVERDDEFISARGPKQTAPRSAFVAGVSALLDASVFPTAGWGLELQLGWDYAWLRGAVVGGLLPTQRSQVQADTRAGFGLAFAGGMLCGQSSFGGWRTLACGELELGRLTAQAVGGPAPIPAGTAWRALLAHLAISWPSDGPVAMMAALGLGLPLTRTEFFWVAACPRTKFPQSACVPNWVSQCPYDGNGSRASRTPTLRMKPASPRAQHPEPGMEPQDFRALYNEEFPFVWRCLRAWGVPPAALDDAAQEVFLVVHRRLPEFRGESSVRTWLYSIVRYVAWNIKRSARRQEQHAEIRDDEPSDHADPFDSLESRETARAIHAFVDRLDDKRRDLFVLAILERMAIPEVAATLGIPMNTAYTRVRVLKQELQLALVRHRGRS